MDSVRDSGFWWSSRHAFLLLLCFNALTASEHGTIDAESWLRQYGYVAPRPSTDSSSRSFLSNQDLSEPIREMQRFYDLEVTGQMDQQTITAMQRPRCGVPDKTNVGFSSYKAVGTKWDKYNLTYSIESFASNIQWQETLTAIRKAFQVWEDVSQFHFEEISYVQIYNGLRNEADIMLSFHSGPHRGHDPFSTLELAHASAPKPGSRGDVHFNSALQWSITNQHVQGFYNVFLVAVHELGHSLGLDHSSDTSSIMYPTYHWMDTGNFQMPADDRQGIQHIYDDQKPNCDALIRENSRLKIENKNLIAENGQLKANLKPTTPPGYGGPAGVPNAQGTKVANTAVELCPGGWKTFGGRCYYVNTEYNTWQEARGYCLSQGADLVVINSPEEQEFIRGLNLRSYSWIGLERSGSRPSWTWTWVDGTPVTTQYWSSRNPYDYEDRNCAMYNHHTKPGRWENSACTAIKRAICEK